MIIVDDALPTAASSRAPTAGHRDWTHAPCVMRRGVRCLDADGLAASAKLAAIFSIA